MIRDRQTHQFVSYLEYSSRKVDSPCHYKIEREQKEVTSMMVGQGNNSCFSKHDSVVAFLDESSQPPLSRRLKRFHLIE